MILSARKIFLMSWLLAILLFVNAVFFAHAEETPPADWQASDSQYDTSGGTNTTINSGISLQPTGGGQPVCGPEGTGYRLCVPLPDSAGLINNGVLEGSSLVSYISLLYRFALGIIGLLVFIMVTWGGIQYVLSAGSADKSRAARTTIFSAIIGGALGFSSYIILNTINPALVNLREPGASVAPTVMSLEQQAAENRQLHSFDGSVETGLKNYDTFVESNDIQKGFLQGQIDSEMEKPNPDLTRLNNLRDSLDQAQSIRYEVDRRHADGAGKAVQL